jgi:tetratricopeptide (TPR) repeat protein
MAQHEAAVTEYARAVQTLTQTEPDGGGDDLAGVTTTVPFPDAAAETGELTAEIQELYTDTIRQLHAWAPRLEDEPRFSRALAAAQAVFGDGLARNGRWEEASRQFQQSIQLEPGSFERSEKAAILFLACDQVEEYRRLCQELWPLVDTFPDQEMFLMNRAGTDDWASIIDLSHRRFSDPELPSLTQSVAAIHMGCAEYRRGRADRSIAWLREYGGRVLYDYNPVRAHLFLAMALHDLGDSTGAIESLKHARFLMDQLDQENRSTDLGLRWRGWLQSRILDQEAATLLGVAAKWESSPGPAPARRLPTPSER